MKYKAETDNNRTGMALLLILLAVGVTAGAVYSVKGQYTDCFWVHQYLVPCGYSELPLMTVRSAAFSVLFLAAVFLTGTSAVGQPFSLLLLLYRCFGAGLSAAEMYLCVGSEYSFAAAVIMLVKTAVQLMTAFAAVRGALRSSCGLACYFAAGGGTGNGESFRLYIARFAFLSFISVLVSAGGAVLTGLVSQPLRM